MKKGLLLAAIAIIGCIGFMSFAKEDLNKQAAQKVMAANYHKKANQTCFNSFYDWPPGLPTNGSFNSQADAQTAANNFATAMSVQYKIKSINTTHIGSWGWFYEVCYV